MFWYRTARYGHREARPEDWALETADGRAVARIYKCLGGPHVGRWAWFVHVLPDGKAGQGGQGYADTDRQAKEACEALMPMALNR